jgi:nitrogen fixation NifU-like protein
MPDIIAELAGNQKLFGRMNDPVGSAHIKGLCGDEMEFYLVIRNETIEEAQYYTEGCEVTRACGAAVARAAHGLSVRDGLGINPKQITNQLGELPPSHRHCPILAVSTFYKAIADYMLKP